MPRPLSVDLCVEWPRRNSQLSRVVQSCLSPPLRFTGQREPPFPVLRRVITRRVAFHQRGCRCDFDACQFSQRRPRRHVRRPRPTPIVGRRCLRTPGRLGDLGQAVALVLKRLAVRAGLDASEVAGHSLRAGLATSAAAAGVPERVIAEQTGHKGTVMLRRYIREGSLFRENAASAVGL
jgi:hypothetical protein